VDNLEIYGSAGPVVLLLPGGAEAADGFFPGLADGLVANPGCRVVAYDRPGTGKSREAGTLSSAASDLKAAIDFVGAGRVVVVGQSLGGAVALLLAAQYPEAVAGLVLLDPTPINDVKGCARLERTMPWIGRLSGVPLVRTALQAALRRGMQRSMRNAELRPDCREALDRIGNADLSQLADSVRGISDLAASFDPTAIPAVPIVLITADRKATGSIARSHAELAASINADLSTWSHAAHNLQLDHPDETLEAVRSLVAQLA
jgi:pimeloyl-ACP methyl ester carboxylesterase